MALPTLNAADLAAFHGTAHWYRHGVIRNVLYTDGAKYVADQAGAYWLLDAIAIAQACDRQVAAEGLQVWVLVVHDDQRATLTCEDGNAHQGRPAADSVHRLSTPKHHPVVCRPGHHAPE